MKKRLEKNIVFLLVFTLIFQLTTPFAFAAPTYTAVFNGNANTSGSAPTSISWSKNKTITLPSQGSLLKTGYSFAGWNTSAAGTGTSYTAGQVVNLGSVNITLYAKWTALPIYTATFSGNGNTSGTTPSNMTWQSGQTVTLPLQGSLLKTGYSFAGWNTSAAGTGTSYTAGQVVNLGSVSITLYAKWTALPIYTATFSGNGNTSGTTPSNMTWQSGQTVTLPLQGSLLKTGYSFAGWNTSAAGTGTSYTAGQVVNLGSVSITLYAKWTALPIYTATFSGNGNTSGTTPSNMTWQSGQTVTLPLQGSLLKTGYSFAGWDTSAAGTGTSYTAGQVVNLGSANITLYAKWTDESMTVTTGLVDCISPNSVMITYSGYDTESEVFEFGIELADNQIFTDSKMHVNNSSPELFYILNLDELTTYYYRAYIKTMSPVTYYGETKTFTTAEVEPDLGVRNSTRGLIEEITYLNGQLEQYDITVEDLIDLPEKSVGFYEELASLANISSQSEELNFGMNYIQDLQTCKSNMSSNIPGRQTFSENLLSLDVSNRVDDKYSKSENLSTTQTDDDLRIDAALFGSRMEYAYHIAGVNQARDSYAHTFEDEVVYMYLSHFIDVQPGQIGNTVDYNSNQGYYSAWITNDDRNVYNAYLSYSSLGEVANKMRIAATSMYSLTRSVSSTYKAYRAFAYTTKFRQGVADAIKVYRTTEGITLRSQDLGIALNKLNNALGQNLTPEQTAAMLENNLGLEGYDAATAKFLKNTAINMAFAFITSAVAGSLSLGAVVGVLPVAFTLYTINMVSMAYKDFYDYVAWVSMVYSLSGRTAGRLMRYLGM